MSYIVNIVIKSVFQNTIYICTLCDDDKTFNMPWKVKKHLKEVQSGFGYKCPRPRCGKILPRPVNHSPYDARPMEMILYHPETGANGEAAEKMLNKWQEERLPSLWQEAIKSPFEVPKPISPLPNGPERLASPLEKCYNRGKRPASQTTYNEPPKRINRVEGPVEDELDLRSDPVAICLEPHLLMDLGLPALMDLNPDPSLAGVTFEPPTQITESDLQLSSDTSSWSSSSSSSLSSSSCDSDSDDEFNLTHFEPLQIVIPGLAAEKEKGYELCESTNSKMDSKDKRKRKEEKKNNRNDNGKGNGKDENQTRKEHANTKSCKGKTTKESKSKTVEKTDKRNKQSRKENDSESKRT